MTINKIKIKIYLKDRLYPLKADLPSDKYVDDFMFELSSAKEYITFGEITFKRADVKLVVVKHKGE